MNAYSEGAFLSLLLSRVFSRTFLSSGAIGVPIFSAFSRILPNSDTISSHRQSTRLRQVCRGRIVASREGYPVGCIVRMVATGGIYAAPTEYPSYCNRRKFTPHPSPAATVSPQGEAIRAVCPVGWRWRKTARRGQDPSLQTTGR